MNILTRKGSAEKSASLTKIKGRKQMERNAKGIPEAARGMAETCPENDAATLHDKPLGYAYVPIQRWRMLYSPEDGMERGTLFEELDMPMEVYGDE